MKSKFLQSLAVTLILASPTNLLSQNNEVSLRQVSQEFFGLAYTEQVAGQTKVVGFTVDLSQEIGRLSGYPIKFSIVPFARIRHELTQGVTDIVTTAPNQEIDSCCELIQTPVFDLSFSLYFNSQKPLTLQQLQDSAYKIGILNGSLGLFEGWLKEKKINTSKIEIRTSFDTMLMGLSAQRLDAIIISDLSFDFILSSSQLKAEQFTQPLPMFSTPWYIKISKKSKHYSPQLIDQLSKAATQIHNSNFAAQLRAKWVAKLLKASSAQPR